MKNYLKYIFIVLILIILGSCTTRDLDVGYGNTCFNKNNEIVYLKYHMYFHWNYTLLLSAEVYETHKYISYMNISGDEYIEEIIPGQIPPDRISEGNGRLCIQTIGYDAYTYIDGEFKEILIEDRVIHAVVSFDGKKIMYTESNADILTISDINGSNKIEHVEGFAKYWHPDNRHVVYSIWGNYYLLDTTTSNTQTIPYAYKWSHDEQRIAYYDETDHLVLMNEDETGKVVTDWIDKDHRVVWSYDGEYLLSDFHLLDKNGNLIRTLRERK